MAVAVAVDGESDGSSCLGDAFVLMSRFLACVQPASELTMPSRACRLRMTKPPGSMRMM